jgi:hypothetical protein
MNILFIYHRINALCIYICLYAHGQVQVIHQLGIFSGEPKYLLDLDYGNISFRFIAIKDVY